jgi:DNA polymerase III subunit alpha
VHELQVGDESEDGRMKQWADLHGHTTFSPGDGHRMPVEHMEACAEVGVVARGFTEHGNVSSHVKAEQAAAKVGVKAVFGCELYCDTGDARGQTKHHLTALAMDQPGLKNLYEVVSKSWENYHYKPTTTGEMLAEHADGLIVLSGCLGSRLAGSIMGGKGVEEKASADVGAGLRTAAQFREIFGDRYYLEVQGHPLLERQRAYNAALAEIGSRLGIPLVVTGDVHYPTEADQDLYPILHAIDRGGSKNTVEAQSQSWEYGLLLAHQSYDAVRRGLTETGLSARYADGALATSLEVAERCNVTLPKLKDLTYPGGKPGEELFWDWLRAGWRYRGLGRLNRAERREYLARLKREANLIIEKGFVDYFLVISDIVRWSKNHGIPVGPARGSAAASLVCWLLRITEVNPMLFPNLIFERFIDVNRHDLPDVDLDFDDELRYKVRERLVAKYGAERVGNIGTFTMYRGKNSLEAVGKVFRVPVSAVEEVKGGLLERSSGDLRYGQTIEDTIALFPKIATVFDKYPDLRHAQRLEGNLAGFSVHAAGLVVANGPLTENLAVYVRYDTKKGAAKGTKKGEALSIDKYDAEYLNVLKIDALGLKTMGLIRHALETIDMTLEELYAIPLDDPKVYDGFRRNEVIGVFQFDGRAMRSVNREVKPDNFAEVCDINALARPGPLHSGAAAQYIMAKHGKVVVEKLHPVVTEITKHTNGQIVYQEQILRTVRELGGFTWEEAALVRKLISKKQGEQAFNRLQSKFMEGAAKLGVKDTIAGRVWKQLVTAGAYAFNAAHCVSYGMLAYWTMWLKQNHPLAFYRAALLKYDDKDKQLDIMREMAAKGIKILPPDPALSQMHWIITDVGLLAGFADVKGFGEKTAEAMLAYRRDVENDGLDHDWSWDDYINVKGIGPVTMQAMKEFCAADDPFGIHWLERHLDRARRWLAKHGERAGLPWPSSRSEDVPYEAIRGEHSWIGIVVHRNLKDIYELHQSRTGEELDPATVKQPEYPNYAVVTGMDETGPLTITIPRWQGFYDKHKDDIWDLEEGRDLLLVTGYKRAEYRRAITATEVHVLAMEE